jgi:hypothetical protein
MITLAPCVKIHGPRLLGSISVSTLTSTPHALDFHRFKGGFETGKCKFPNFVLSENEFGCDRGFAFAYMS